MAGVLYLCPTPIGNLEDITARVLRVLGEVPLIAAEDTRTSMRLLNHFGITTPLTSYHKFNEEKKSGELIGHLLAGKDLALITDAGMPAVSDPGETLVRKCHEHMIRVEALPGPSAVVTAVAASGQDTRRFVFEGFLSQEKKERDERLAALSSETRTMVFYEAPHRLVKTLSILADHFGKERSVTVCHELSKKHETVKRTSIEEALAFYEAEPPKGEFVLVVAGRPEEEIRMEEAAKWEEMSVPEHVAYYEARGMDRKEAMKAAAKDRGVTKRDIYKEMLDAPDII